MLEIIGKHLVVGVGALVAPICAEAPPGCLQKQFQSSLAHHANLGLRQALASVKKQYRKNIQIVDAVVNGTYSVFQATDEELAVIFPDGTRH
ncbi:hypothetical protein EN745_11940 [Mesorhizobium sp. M4A.F.Ca.ET.022.05.2.1]|uniref:hypothetical protein n=1 Tax=Mesorhizobium sp. M4A.F.Ca.ET.022.05.2.1 TaxID=2496653 RepID=UPI000FC9EB6E|nr:hypothetical protein [Mesorhizobium sp. M4A.F.Ca.ET.022.05.2.1]RVC80762.1 hypothetical protein EN745_11940 [Mesorhizobium sp. M4A.F.Ca.ET.022.05.2.1]